jgi:hypothetical protein
MLLACGHAPVPALPVDGGTDGASAPDGGHARDAGIAADAGQRIDGGARDAGAINSDGGEGGVAPCPADLVCVDAFPFVQAGDTTWSARRALNAYNCAPRTNEGGPEVVYRVVVDRPGILGARVRDAEFTDIDLHILRELDAASCMGRDDAALSRFVEPGTYFVVADTWVDGAGVERLGSFEIEIHFRPVADIACAMRTEPLPRVQGDVLQMPATGAVVLEAHLVSTAEAFDGGWPTSARDGLERHYGFSEMATGYVMRRTQVWAPEGEGGSMWGQGSAAKPPLDHEGWYVNMYWRMRPARGTRMIIRQPSGPLAVVAAAGYETGPGSATAIGGATEEIHDYLGTTHRDTLTMGFAVDESLPVGPVRCAGP